MKKIAIAVALSALLSGCSSVGLGAGVGFGGGSFVPGVSVSTSVDKEKAEQTKQAQAIAKGLKYNDAQLCAAYGYSAAPLEGVVNSASKPEYDEAYSHMSVLKQALELRIKGGTSKITPEDCKKAKAAGASAWRKEQALKAAQPKPLTAETLLN